MSFPLTLFDLSVIGVVSISIIFGFLCGFRRSAIFFCGYVIALIFAVLLSDMLADLFTGYVNSRASSIMISTIIILILFSVLIRFVSNIVFPSEMPSTVLDKSFGVLFGFLRGCLLVSFLFYLLTFIMPEMNVNSRSDIFGDNTKLPKWAKKSETLMLVSKSAQLLSMIFPDKFNSDIDKSVEELNSASGDSSSSGTNDARGLHKIFGLLPETVLNEIPQQDLIDIQDQSLPPASKVGILKHVADLYAKYMSDNAYGSKEEKSAQKHYHKVMSAIDAEIAKYNEETEDEE